MKAEEFLKKLRVKHPTIKAVDACGNLQDLNLASLMQEYALQQREEAERQAFEAGREIMYDAIGRTEKMYPTYENYKSKKG